jgi:hypothetical protein
MDAICRKCGNTYQAKRSTSKYCKKSCRSAYNQQVKRGLALANPLSNDEAFLLNVLLDVVYLAAAVLDEARTTTTSLSNLNLTRLRTCVQVKEYGLIKQLQGRYAEKQRLDAKKQQATKKPTRPAKGQGG